MSPSALTANFPLPTPVLVVEDVPPVRLRLEEVLLRLGYAHEALMFAATLAEAHARIERQSIALALIDVGLPDGNGLSLIPALRSGNPDMCIVVISAWSTPKVIIDALRAGATSYILKERDDIEITLALRSALRGGVSIDPFIARHLIEELPFETEPASPTGEASAGALSQREQQILRLVSQGLRNQEIANQLHLSPRTVESHIVRIYQKLAVSSRTQAVHVAHQQGLLK